MLPFFSITFTLCIIIDQLSYYLDEPDGELVAAQTDYGFAFTSAIARDNLFALQCHPEKSADAGLQLLRNFVAWNGQS